jgi:hypothetical protein
LKKQKIKCHKNTRGLLEIIKSAKRSERAKLTKQDKLFETNVVNQAVCSCQNLGNFEISNIYRSPSAQRWDPKVHKREGVSMAGLWDYGAALRR